jgi:hypothetical protein
VSIEELGQFAQEVGIVAVVIMANDYILPAAQLETRVDDRWNAQMFTSNVA